MNHNNTDDDKINNDTSNKEQSLEETSKSLDNEDDFFTSNAPQKTTHESRSYLILILIIAFSMITGLLVFSFIYDIAGIRTSVIGDTQDSEYTNLKIPKQAQERTKSDAIFHKSASDNLNASKQFKEDNKSIHDNTTNTDNDNNNNSPLAILDDLKEKNISLQEDTEQTIDNNFDNQINQNLSEFNYQNKINSLQKEFKSVSKLFFILNQKLVQGEPYLNVLIELKTQLRKYKTDIPTLTEYASAGFPTDLIIVTDATKLLKKLSIIESQKQSDDIISNIVRKFVIVTPKSGIQGLSGVFYKISKALNNGDYDTVSMLIYQLSPETQKSFTDLQLLISDKKKIYSEMSGLNDAIISNIFAQSQTN